MTPGPIVGLVVGIVLIFVISTASIGIMTLRWYRKHDRKESVDEKLSSKLEMGAQIEFSGRQPKHNRASMLLGVSKDSINLTRPKFTIRRQKKNSVSDSVFASHDVVGHQSFTHRLFFERIAGRLPKKIRFYRNKIFCSKTHPPSFCFVYNEQEPSYPYQLCHGRRTARREMRPI